MDIRTFFVTQDREKSTVQSKEQQPRSPLIQLKERSLLFQLNDQQPTQSLHQVDVQVLFWVVFFPTILAPLPPYCCARHLPYHDEQKGANVILTVSGESQLSAGHICIRSPPGVITHSTPLVVHANLNTTLGRIGSKPCQSDLASLTASCIITGV